MSYKPSDVFSGEVAMLAAFFSESFPSFQLSFAACDSLSNVFLHRVYDLLVLAFTGSDVAKQFIDDFEVGAQFSLHTLFFMSHVIIF